MDTTGKGKRGVTRRGLTRFGYGSYTSVTLFSISALIKKTTAYIYIVTVVTKVTLFIITIHTRAKNTHIKNNRNFISYIARMCDLKKRNFSNFLSYGFICR